MLLVLRNSRGQSFFGVETLAGAIYIYRGLLVRSLTLVKYKSREVARVDNSKVGILVLLLVEVMLPLLDVGLALLVQNWRPLLGLID